MDHSLSVALCTRNCAPFLGAQLTSILAQTRAPDELVVADEASTDDTPQLLERFAEEAPFPVTILRNSRALGVAANFTQVIRRCRGALIALCDHDDVWMPTRLARGEAALGDPTVALAFSDATLIDAGGRALPGLLWQTLAADVPALVSADDPQVFRALLARRLVTGGTMTMRAEVARWALPIADGWYQDEWLAQLAALRGRLVAIPEPQMQYRQHAGNAVGARQDGLAPRLGRAFDGARRGRIEAQRAQLGSLHEALAGRPEAPAWAATAVGERLAHLQGRLAVRGGPLERSAALWRELRTGRYSSNSRGYWSALQDLLG